MNNNIDTGELKKDIQDFFQDGTLTIVGSGLSAAEGIPGMEKLAIELKKKMSKKLKEGSKDKEIWDKIAEKLSQNVGLEAALLNMGLPENGEVEKNIRRITADYIEKAEQNVLRKILNGNKALRFSEYINCFGENKDHVVITTNYDRLVEYACGICGRRIDTLCEGKYISNFNPQYRRNNLYSNETKRNGRQHTGFAPKVTILKPHGCLSWHMINDEPFYSPYFHNGDPLIITPGANKYRKGYVIPFDTYINRANDAIDKAHRYIIIGYGFGDEHLETHLVKYLKSGKPALILTKDLSPKAEEIIKKSRHIIALCCDTINGENSTKIIKSPEKESHISCNLWDIREMLREVF